MSELIKKRLGHCGECKWFKATGKRDSFWNDGICIHPTRNGKNRKTPYKVYSHAGCCFDAEDPDSYRQITMEEVFDGQT